MEESPAPCQEETADDPQQEAVLDDAEDEVVAAEDEDEDEPSVGSTDRLDTINLTTSPTMESLDLGDTKSLDSLRLDLPEQEPEPETSDISGTDQDPGIEINVRRQDEAEAIETNGNVQENHESEQIEHKKVDIVSEVTVTKPEPRLCDYFSDAGTDGNVFDSIVIDIPVDKESDNAPVDQVVSDSDVVETPPAPPGDIHETKSDTDVEVSRKKHKSGSTIVETPSCSFEGESDLKDKIGSVSDLVMESQGEKNEQSEFFESFTAEEEEKETESELKPVKKASYIMPHLSPGPSPNTSAYASPIRQMSVPPSEVSAVSTSPRAPSIQDEVAPSPFSSSHDLEDAFSASISMSEADRRKDAWIASDVTKQTLVSMATNAPGTFYPRQDQLTMPGILLDERQGDPVVELMYKCMSEHDVMKRQTLTADMVSQDEEGLRKLIRSECYRSALDLTSKLLTLHGQGMGRMNLDSKNSPETLQLWFVRMAMLMKLKLYQVAESELAPFANFDKADMYYEFYPDLYPGRKGCMVPFSLRILHAELPHFMARSQDALDRLYYIYAILKKILSNLDAGLSEDGLVMEMSEENKQASRDLWTQREIRLLYSIVNILVGAKIYDSAVELMETLIQKDSQNEASLISTLGRLYLQMGDVTSARQQFDHLETLLDESDDVAQSKIYMNRGFVALGMNDFEAAKQNFQMVVELDPGNGVAVNNMAVCSLYTGKLREALHVLESLVQANPARYLQDCILINLCTLYELESSRALQKKQRLLQMVAEHKGNGFNVHCLKMGELMMKK